MANIKSQIKRNRQNEKRRIQNRVYRGTARKAIRNTLVAIETGEPEDARSKAMAALKALDKAAAKRRYP